MSIEKVVERIISDAENAARNAVTAAEKRAAEITAEAESQAERARIGTEAEVAAKCKALSDGMLAQSRLDGAKQLLQQKRRVIDSVYERVREQLNKLTKSEALKLSQRLLEQFAEEGDEIAFAPDFAYAKEVSALDEVKSKKLKVKPNDANVDGGFVLRGKTADKDVSFGALVAADKEEYQAELAMRIFNK